MKGKARSAEIQSWLAFDSDCAMDQPAFYDSTAHSRLTIFLLNCASNLTKEDLARCHPCEAQLNFVADSAH